MVVAATITRAIALPRNSRRTASTAIIDHLSCAAGGERKHNTAAAARSSGSRLAGFQRRAAHRLSDGVREAIARLVPRFRSSRYIAAPFDTNFGSKGALASS